LNEYTFYWVKPRNKPLMAVAAQNLSQAANLFEVNRATLQRSGGAWNPATSENTGVLSSHLKEAYPKAMARPGRVYVLESRWFMKRNSRRKDALAAKNKAVLDKQQSRSGRKEKLMVRMVRLSRTQCLEFRKLGGGGWLREEVRKADILDAVPPTRSKEPNSVPISFRMTDTDWARFQMLGGKAWLLKTMSYDGPAEE
jgi:hypothetical protein